VTALAPFLVALATAGQDPSPANSCLSVWTESRYRAFGYDHIVHIQNGCAYNVVCVVSTNVNPDPVDVEVEAGQHVEVLTYKASPWRTFTAKATCTEIE
jgi:hypothetical protein